MDLATSSQTDASECYLTILRRLFWIVTDRVSIILNARHPPIWRVMIRSLLRRWSRPIDWVIIQKKSRRR